MNNLLAYTTSIYTVPALIVCVFLLLATVLHLYYRLSIFMRGENDKSFETTVRTYLDQMDDVKKHDELISKYALDLDARISECVRNVSAMRFKAFDTNSSNQSFAIALVNEKGDGVVISSLHHNAHTQIFAKPIIKYTSTHDLTDEEKTVLEESRKANKRSS